MHSWPRTRPVVYRGTGEPDLGVGRARRVEVADEAVGQVQVGGVRSVRQTTSRAWVNVPGQRAARSPASQAGPQL